MVQEFVRQEPIGDKVKMQTARESIKRGIALGEQGRWQEAILEYRRAVELDDQNPRFWLGLGNALSEAEEWQEAVDCYQRVIQLRPEAAQGHHGLGDALAKLGQWPEAEIAYRQAIRLRPDFSWSYNNLGDVLRQLQKWDEAVAAYQRAIELNPEFVWSHHNLAEGLVKLERWAEAEKAYHQLMELKPDLPHVKDKLQHVIAQQQQLSDIKHEGVQGKELPGRDNSNENSGVDATLQGQAKQYFDQGEALRSQGQWEAARNCYYKVVQSEPRYWKAHHHLGDACLNLEQYQDAVSAYRHALKYNPQSTWSYYNLGITLQKLGQRKAAFNCHQKIIEIDPRFWEANLVDSSILRQNLHQASPPPIQNHQHDHPVERDQLASDLPPTVVQEIPKTPPKTVFQESVASLQSIEICFERAKLLTAEARPQEALEYYRRAIELEPQNWQVYHQLGDYWMGQEAWKSALVEYRKAISLNADAEWSHCNLGRALCHLNAVEEGINTLRHAIEVNPASGWMSFYLGEAQFQAEDWDGAIAAYRRSIELMPDSSQFQQRLGDALHQKSKGFAQQALAIYLETIKADPDNIELYHKAIAIKPFDANLYVQLCRTLIRQGQFSQAIVFYQMGLQAVIDDPDIYPQFDLLEIGNLCAGQEKYQEAVFFYQEGLNIEPENDLLGWQIQNIRAIQNREFAYPIETAEYIRLKEIQALSLPTSKTPTISIIIPVYNQILHTYNCLRSIAATMDGSIPYEVIVMDDHSKDHTQEVLAQIQGVQSVFNEQNLGFIGSCNRGASLAKGQYLFFLNNDTVVMPSCFEELLETFRLFPRAGLVGAKFLYPNGMLQEAGGIIWQDGSAWNYGRQDHPNKPEYCYLREVDYCSGAGIMIPRELWNQIGGFDVRLKPAYYEDTDLAFEVRQAGYQVLYQPLAQIIHFEGISSGTDLTKGMKQYQVVNHQKFLDKWAAVLQGHRPNAVEPYLERERPVQQRLLMIDARMLTPDQDSGSLTACNLIKIFQALGYKVTFAPDNLMYVSKYTEDLQRIGVECLYCSHVSSMRSYLETYGRYYDVVYLSRLEVTEKYLNDVRAFAPQAMIIYDTVDLHHLREIREAKLKNSVQLYEKAMETKRRELALMNYVDCTLVVSQLEKRLLEREQPDLKNIEFFPMPREIYGAAQNFAERQNMVFIGGFEHPPNVDAVLYFVQEIFPRVKQAIGQLKFFVIGSKAPQEIMDLASEDVVIAGYVPELGEYFNHCKLSVAPLRYGAGIKGKILTSCCYGLPVVATPIAVEGMGLQDGHDVLVGDTAERFAQQVIEVYRDEGLWTRISQNSLATVASRYSMEAVTGQFGQLLNRLRATAAK